MQTCRKKITLWRTVMCLNSLRKTLHLLALSFYSLKSREEISYQWVCPRLWHWWWWCHRGSWWRLERSWPNPVVHPHWFKVRFPLHCTDDPIKRRETNIKFRHLKICILYCHGSHVGEPGPNCCQLRKFSLHRKMLNLACWVNLIC